MVEFNSHLVGLHRCVDGQQGWPVCKDLGSGESLVPRLAWEDWGWTTRLRCTGHVEYQPDSFYEADARRRLGRLRSAALFGLVVNKPFMHQERRRRALEAAAEARSLAQRFLPLRSEFEAAALELDVTARALAVGEYEDWLPLLEVSALEEASVRTRALRPDLAGEVESWHRSALNGLSLSSVGTVEADLEVRDRWILAYRDALLAPWHLASVQRRTLRSSTPPRVLRLHGEHVLVEVPRPVLRRYAKEGLVLASVRSTPRLREGLPVLWDPTGNGPLSSFEAAVEAVELLS